MGESLVRETTSFQVNSEVFKNFKLRVIRSNTNIIEIINTLIVSFCDNPIQIIKSPHVSSETVACFHLYPTTLEKLNVWISTNRDSNGKKYTKRDVFIYLVKNYLR
jgi:hypothetical protein